MATPQLTHLVDAAPEGHEWLHEMKFDGCRMHARLDRGAVTSLTRASFAARAGQKKLIRSRFSCTAHLGDGAALQTTVHLTVRRGR